jgi:hypothetical protein
MSKNRKWRLEPAYSIIETLGDDKEIPEAKIAEFIGCHWTQVRKWTYPKSSGGTGGLVPAKYHEDLFRYAQEKEKDLRPEMFFLSA